MQTLSNEDYAFILKALVERRDKVQRKPPYPSQSEDVSDYNEVIRKVALNRGEEQARRTS